MITTFEALLPSEVAPDTINGFCSILTRKRPNELPGAVERTQWEVVDSVPAKGLFRILYFLNKLAQISSGGSTTISVGGRVQPWLARTHRKAFRREFV